MSAEEVQTRQSPVLAMFHVCNLKVVEQRLAKYENTTRPLLDLYGEENLLHSFSGEESDVIYRDVRKFLSETLPKGNISDEYE